jgi:DNA-binding CsgD family transcriptional regulator
MCHDFNTSLVAAMADALDGLHAGMFLVDACGRIVHANAAGHVLTAQGDVLCSASGRLAAREAQIDQTLRDAFARAAASGEAIRAKAIPVPLVARDGTRYAAHVLPLSCGARRRAGTIYAATAAVSVNEAVLDVRSLPEIIAEAYRLTPAELRTLLAIVELGGVPEVAHALGVAESTVRTHLGRLFQKTATSRQAGLVGIVAGFANPFVS